MSPLASPISTLHLGRDRVLQALRPHARPLTLACGLASALIVWSVPAATEVRCPLVRQAALGWQGAISMSIALTVLAWYSHKPMLRQLLTIWRRPARD